MRVLLFETEKKNKKKRFKQCGSLIHESYVTTLCGPLLSLSKQLHLSPFSMAIPPSQCVFQYAQVQHNNTGNQTKTKLRVLCLC